MRNRTFDLFKWAAALFVLLLHVPFPGDVGGTVRMFARWAVPFFFMVSGYLHTVRCSERMPVGWCAAYGDCYAFLFRRPDFTRFGVAFCLVTKPRRPFLRAIMRWKM